MCVYIILWVQYRESNLKKYIWKLNVVLKYTHVSQPFPIVHYLLTFLLCLSTYTIPCDSTYCVWHMCDSRHFDESTGCGSARDSHTFSFPEPFSLQTISHSGGWAVRKVTWNTFRALLNTVAGQKLTREKTGRGQIYRCDSLRPVPSNETLTNQTLFKF